MTSNARKKLIPIGSNMNDAAYPFRGEHKLEDCINHGHSGVSRKAPTSIGMRITGSNLVIEQVQTPKGVTLECELGVDGGIPRPVSLQQASALMVPGDGHDYNLTATLRANGSASKHYCKLTFNGSEGTNVLRVRAPEGCHPDSVYIVADGRRLRPTAGWFRIPIQTKDCSLVVNFPMLDGGTGGGAATFLSNPWFPTPSQGSGANHAKSPRSPPPQRSPTRQGGVAAEESTTPAAEHFFLETVVASPPPANATQQPQPLQQQPSLVCTSTGDVIPLLPHSMVAVPHAGAPFRLVLPAPTSNVSVPATAAPPTSAPLAVPEIETRIEPPAAPAALPDAASAPGGGSGPVSGMPAFVVTAPNYSVQLVGEDGSSATGQGVATLPLTHRRAQALQVIVRDAQGNVVARQKSHIPALQSAPAALQMKDDDSGTLVVSTRPGNKLTVGGVPQANPAVGAALPRVVAQQVVVEQPNGDGTVSTLALDVAAKGGGAPTMPPSVSRAPVPVPIPLDGTQPAAAAIAASASPAAAAPEKWVMELCTALQKPNIEEQRRLTQAIQPSTLPGMTIVNFVRDQLTQQPPAISFTVSKNGLESVQCPGCSISASVGNEAPRMIPSFGSVQLAAGKPAVLTATSMSSQRPVSACRVQMANLSSDNASPFAASSYNPYGTAAPSSLSAENKADTELVTRVLDSLIRHNVNAAEVADELGGTSTASFSAQGRRLVPLLTTCLRSASASGAAAAAAKAANDQAAAAAAAAAAQAKTNEEIFFTCGSGYVDNIYTSTPQLQLFGAVDDQAPQVLQQRGRVPAQGVLEGDRKPFFVRLTARDPATGAVKVERTITVLGVAPPPPTTQPTTAAATTPLALLTAESQNSGGGNGGGGASPAAPSPPTKNDSSPTAAAATGAPMPYIDVSLQTVGQDVQARFLCPPHLRIVCDVDGVGGHTGLSDFVTKMPATRFHRVNLSLVDTYGKVVFQQKLDVPAMSSPVWGLAVQHNGLAVDPESGSLATASVDRSPERALEGNFLSFDATLPHYVNLRKYLNGIHGSCVGEVMLRLPGLTLPPELAEVTSILRHQARRQLSSSQAKAELQQLRPRCTSPAVSELISCILDNWPGGGGAVYSPGLDSLSNRVFFRLTGSD